MGQALAAESKIPPLSGRPIFDARPPGFFGAVGATVDPILRLNAMPDNCASAMRASRRHTLDRAFEAVEGHGSIALSDQDGLVVHVPTHIALGHFTNLSIMPKGSPS